jgi:2-oxoglutarate dehydrogenase E2 component (dihydrolipoamide succinyltransferase)
MSVSVSMPQLGESVTEGTVTRWLKHEGDHVSADEPLLEVSTDKVDTEIPSPVSGILRGITVAEDETVAVGAELAVIDEDGSAGAAQAAAPAAAAQAPVAEGAGPVAGPPGGYQQPAYQPAGQPDYAAPGAQGYQQQGYQEQDYQERASQEQGYQEQGYQQGEPPAERPPGGQPGYQPATGYEPPPSYAEPGQPPAYPPYAESPSSYEVPVPERGPAAPYYPAHAESEAPVAYQPPGPAYEPVHAEPAPAPAPPQPFAGQPAPPPAAPPPVATPPAEAPPGAAPPGAAPQEGSESPYVTPLVRKLAAEHGIDLGSVRGTGVGGRIRKQDVLDAARQRDGGEAPRPAAGQAPQPPPAAAPAQPPGPQAQGQAAEGGRSVPKTIPAPSSLRGTTERLSRARQVIAQRMVESLQTSAQLTTVVEADVTAIARLRDRTKAAFEAREGVKLSFLPFFALAAVEALKAHPKVNAVIDTSNGTVTYHDAEHLGIAVDTDRGLMVPVIRNAGDLNIGGLARKIADLAARTRAGQVSPDDLTGGTFTLTNTGSRGALFDTPIINQPQVGILGTGTVNKRPVVVDDPDLGEVITVRSIVYLALTYDHRLVDGADAARFLITIKNRLEEGAFEAEFGR